MKTLSSLFLALFTLTLLTGCAAFRSTVGDIDPNEASTLTAGYDQKDLISWTDEMTTAQAKWLPSWLQAGKRVNARRSRKGSAGCAGGRWCGGSRMIQGAASKPCSRGSGDCEAISVG